MVRAYVTHFDTCEARLSQEKLGTISPEKTDEAVNTRRELTTQASSQLELLLSGISVESEISIRSQPLLGEDSFLSRKLGMPDGHNTRDFDRASNFGQSNLGNSGPGSSSSQGCLLI